MARYALYADRFKWTPQQVDDLPAWVEARLWDVVGVIDEIREKAEKDAIEKASR